MASLRLLNAHDEVGNIRTFVFENTSEQWSPGQYQRYALDTVDGDEGARTRYFTIAAAPSEGVVKITTRVSRSAFKQALNGLRPGDRIDVLELGGDFIWDGDDPVVLVAAGIGVTPYRSFLAQRAAAGRRIPAHLLYFGRDDNFAFRSEFGTIGAEHPELTIDYIVGEPVNADTILAKAPESGTRPVYLSGPEAMVDTVGEELTRRGIAVKQDWFPGYDEKDY
ncbi:Ferredoxin-NADP reductase [Propionibacterium cyclohexanicum]|uniref:Ferredoxin-NADP reductase n=1 Tax=Propionibacterium cyclohexanicum TaxID=64702 RepID=A0A1H9SQP4_9ACTN|nr:FAD-dependent oxidoreductase [Propionibacterium cyclohexanicum]SER87178.1 Ferredoxin-NADP reductase [Propionibacterium cyclohexanicum]